MRSRVGAVLAAAAVLLPVLLSGCGVLDAEPRPPLPRGCGSCERELARLARALEEVPGVAGVRSTTLTKRAVPVAHLTVGLDLTGTDVVSTDLEAVTDAVAEAVWLSDVDPVDVLSLDLGLRNGYRERDSYAFGADRGTYAERWGDRPAGTAWSPDVPVDDDLEGCEVDRCRDLTRALAREASAVPGVVAVLGSVYLPDDPTSSASVDVTVRVGTTAPAEVEAVVDGVAEAAWRSRIHPVTYISVVVETPAGGFPDTYKFGVDPDVGRDHDRLAARWGPRPVP